jgi:hypothetical protein
MGPEFKFKSKVWLWPGKAAWHFITIPLDLSKTVKAFDDMPRRGFGSLPVEVTIGSTSWKTSIFPEKKGTYVLPLKSAVRKKEGIEEGDTITLKVELR